MALGKNVRLYKIRRLSADEEVREQQKKTKPDTNPIQLPSPKANPSYAFQEENPDVSRKTNPFPSTKRGYANRKDRDVCRVPVDFGENAIGKKKDYPPI